MTRILPLAVLSALPTLAFSTPAIEASLEPAQVRQGEVLRVEVRAVEEEAPLEIRMGERLFPLYPVGPKRLRGLLGFTVKASSGAMELHVLRKDRPGETLRTLAFKLRGKDFGKQNLSLPPDKASLPDRPDAGKALGEIRAALAAHTPPQRWKGLFRLPVEKGRKSSSYGHSRTVNKKKAWDWHKGIDIAAPAGTPVLAPNDGLVALATHYPVQGGVVVLDHGQGVLSAFLHLKTVSVKPGEDVPKGGLIGRIGSHGFSTGPHVHWGVYVHGDAVDPEAWLKREF